MAKPSLMNLHILILILLNGHKISCPQQQLDTEALSQSETFPVLEFVVSDFLFNKALLLPDLYKKFEDLVDKTALIKSLKEPKDKIGEPSPIRGNTATLGFRTVKFFGGITTTSQLW
jgi:hypothetical protein